jgi:hypothetical protein
MITLTEAQVEMVSGGNTCLVEDMGAGAMIGGSAGFLLGGPGGAVVLGVVGAGLGAMYHYMT